ncbi:MAG: DUF4856 domain-containing protein [Chitinophagales bacterium]|nr:MAG: DUF4856 domain-containing protein [Chitinophagales bacterium]
MQINFHQLSFFFYVMGMLLALPSCEKQDDPGEKPYAIPSTYTFTDAMGNSTVDYAGQTQRLNMVAEIVTYLKTANTPGVRLDAQKLRDMYRNAGNPFTDNSLNNSGKQIKDKVFAPDQQLFEQYFDSIAAASQSDSPATVGRAGVGTSGSSNYLFSARGMEYTQLIEKGLMGALMYYQATGVYLDTDKMNADNSTPVSGKFYTEMEHHWDEAFGYFGVPFDFPTNTTGMRFCGKYCNDRDALLGTNKIMQAFIKGRAAISNKDMKTRDEQIILIRELWEKVMAGTAVHYLNGAKNTFTDDVLRNHQLSEAYAFIMSLKYNPARKVSMQQIENWLAQIGDNFYEVTLSSIVSVRDEIAAAYGFENVKEQL